MYVGVLLLHVMRARPGGGRAPPTSKTDTPKDALQLSSFRSTFDMGAQARAHTADCTLRQANIEGAHSRHRALLA